MSRTKRPLGSAEHIHAKLRGAERLLIAGVIDERTYAATVARLERELDAAARPVPAAAAVPVAAPPRRRGRTGLAGVAAAAVLLAGSAATVLAVRSHPPSAAVAGHPPTSPRPRPTPRASSLAFAELAALRSDRPAPGAPVIDGTEAGTLVRAFWDVRDQALAAGDVATIGLLETGSAAAADGSSCSAGCSVLAPRAVSDVRVFVPSLHAFPAAFLAEVVTSTPAGDRPQVDRLVFTRSAASVPWYLALDAAVPGAAHITDVPQTGNDGFDVPAPANPAALPTGRLGAVLAAYFQHWADAGAAPRGTQVAAGALSDGAGAALWARIRSDARAGVHDSVAFSAGAPSWTFATTVLDAAGLPRPGWTETCTTLQDRDLVAPVAAGHPLVQPDDRSTYGGLLAPGSYRSTTVVAVHALCVLEQPGYATLTVAANDATVVAVSAVRA